MGLEDDFAKKLSELDLDGVPEFGAGGGPGKMGAEDTPRPSLSIDEVFANAPKREGDYFIVPNP